MFFNVKEVREFLLANGIVYTLRKKRKRIGKDWAVQGNYYSNKKLARINIEFIGKITKPEDLFPYVQKSGLLKDEGCEYIYTSGGYGELFCPQGRVNPKLICPSCHYYKLLLEKVAKEWFNLAKKLSGNELYLYKVTIDFIVKEVGI